MSVDGPFCSKMMSVRSLKTLLLRMTSIILIVGSSIPFSVGKTYAWYETACQGCICCVRFTDCGDGTSLWREGQCHCNADEDEQAPSPIIISPFLGIGNPLYLSGDILPRDWDSNLPGFERPPMRPPPTPDVSADDTVMHIQVVCGISSMLQGS